VGVVVTAEHRLGVVAERFRLAGDPLPYLTPLRWIVLPGGAALGVGGTMRIGDVGKRDVGVAVRSRKTWSASSAPTMRPSK
jgi:hypothetical protein